MGDLNREAMKDIEYYLYYKNLSDLDVYYHRFGEDVRAYLSGVHSEEELLRIYHSIHKCPKCGGDAELHEFEGMGDGSYTIQCKNCDHSLSRSQYDRDITKWEDVLEFCIRDWNQGLSTEDIERQNEEYRKRISLTADDLKWKPYYPNNMPINGQDGVYALLFRKTEEGAIDCLKWTILGQYKEIEPMLTDITKVESYNLFMQRYSDVKGPLHYPEPSDDCELLEETENTLTNIGVNSHGDFERNYRTLKEAKQGALVRSWFYNYNKNTLLTSDEDGFYLPDQDLD